MLAETGYDPGRDVLAPDPGGPTGFFESRDVNRINERLLAPHDAGFLHTGGYSRPLRDGERWLAVLPADRETGRAPAELRAAMRTARPSSPYCCKDPRFAYTLPSWRPLFAGALFMCVFRHPLATARSIAGAVRYGDLSVSADAALELWKAVYARVLGRHRHDADWVFVHYEQLLDGSAVPRLCDALGATLDSGLAKRELYRHAPDGAPPPGSEEIYSELCALAGHAQ